MGTAGGDHLLERLRLGKFGVRIADGTLVARHLQQGRDEALAQLEHGRDSADNSGIDQVTVPFVNKLQDLLFRFRVLPQHQTRLH